MGFELFQTIIAYIKSLKTADIVLSIFYPFLFFTSLFLTTYAERKGLLKGKEAKASVYAAVALLFAVLGIAVHKLIADPILKYLFRDTAISLTAIALSNAVFSVSSPTRFLKLLTYVGLFSALLVEFLLIFSTNLTLVKILIPLRKFLILAAVFPIVYSLLNLVSLERLRRVLKIFLFVIFLTIGALWELGKIEFDTQAFIGIGIIAFASLLFSWFITQGVILLQRHLKGQFPIDDDLKELIDSSKKFFFLLLLYIYWVSLLHFLNFWSLKKELQKFILIKTEIVEINLWNLIASIFTFLVLYYLINSLKKFVKLLFKPEEREEKGGSLEVLVYNFGMLINASVFLAQLGLTWKVILPLAGALGIGLGFGLQTILNNYVSGFIMMFSKNIKVGDFVELPGNAGKFINNPGTTIFGRVEDISILTTRIKTLDGIDILVPNSTFIGSQIINYTFRNPFVRVRFPFGVAYSSDPRQVKEILLKVAYECPWAKNYYKSPQVWFTEMGDSALIFYLMFWVDIRDIWRNTYATLSHGLFDWVYTNAWYKLKEAGIEIPFPQNDIWFRNKLKVVLEREDGTPLAVLDKPKFPEGKENRDTRKDS